MYIHFFHVGADMSKILPYNGLNKKKFRPLQSKDLNIAVSMINVCLSSYITTVSKPTFTSN